MEAMYRIAGHLKDDRNLSRALQLESSRPDGLTVASLRKYWYCKANTDVRELVGDMSHLLEPEQEALLVAFIQGFSRANWPLRPRDI